jgi:WGR domain
MADGARRMGRPPGEPTKAVRLPVPVAKLARCLAAKDLRRWGRIGCLGRERLQFFGGEDASRAQVTLETWLARKRKRGYAPRSEPARPALLTT